MQVQRAVTLIELLMTLFLLVIILGMALPLGHRFIQRHQAQSVSDQLVTTLQFAKTTAIATQRTLLLCPTADGRWCSDDWNQGYMLFIQHQQSLQPEKLADIIRLYPALPTTVTLSWHGFISNHYLRFAPSYAEQALSGHWHITLIGEGKPVVKKLVLNRLGRINVVI